MLQNVRNRIMLINQITNVIKDVNLVIETMIKRKFFLLVFVVVSMISCDGTGVFDEYKTVSNTWEIDEEINFSIPDLDSLKAYNLFINIRNTNDYQYSNLFIISEMKFPNGKIVKDDKYIARVESYLVSFLTSVSMK